MVTTRSLRFFAADCLADAWMIEDPSQRDVVVNIARSWAKTAESIDRRVRDARGDVLPDLRNKLN
jgi:hypothetical protein